SSHAAQDRGEVAPDARKDGGISKPPLCDIVIEGGNVAHDPARVHHPISATRVRRLAANADIAGVMRIERAFGPVHPAHDVIPARPVLLRAEADDHLSGKPENHGEVIPTVTEIA